MSSSLTLPTNNEGTICLFYEIFECDACGETYKTEDKKRSGELHGILTICRYGERKGYSYSWREINDHICGKCCKLVADALGINLER